MCAFITYITAGLPDLEGTKKLLKAQEEAGLDVVELGIPFSDPVADGPVIQDASYKAICNGIKFKKVFVTVEELRKEGSELPIVFMMYYNTILHYGVEAFVKKCNEVGVDGLIIPDLPLEEQEEITKYLNQDERAKCMLCFFIASASCRSNAQHAVHDFPPYFYLKLI